MEPIIVPRAQHSISRKLIDPDALRVMYRLLRANHRAFLVGGAVRSCSGARRRLRCRPRASPSSEALSHCRIVGRPSVSPASTGQIISVHLNDIPISGEGETDVDRLIRSDNAFGAGRDAIRGTSPSTVSSTIWIRFPCWTLGRDETSKSWCSPSIPTGASEDLRILRAVSSPPSRLPSSHAWTPWSSTDRYPQMRPGEVLEEIYRLAGRPARPSSF
jgi:hypothetical protein